jgi:hypothetical protein
LVLRVGQALELELVPVPEQEPELVLVLEPEQELVRHSQRQSSHSSE